MNLLIFTRFYWDVITWLRQCLYVLPLKEIKLNPTSLWLMRSVVAYELYNPSSILANVIPFFAWNDKYNGQWINSRYRTYVPHKFNCALSRKCTTIKLRDKSLAFIRGFITMVSSSYRNVICHVQSIGVLTRKQHTHKIRRWITYSS